MSLESPLMECLMNYLNKLINYILATFNTLFSTATDEYRTSIINRDVWKNQCARVKKLMKSIFYHTARNIVGHWTCFHHLLVFTIQIQSTFRLLICFNLNDARVMLETRISISKNFCRAQFTTVI
jgi:hypothetical protein